MKAEEGLCSGQVLYHQHISKPAGEVARKTRDIKDREELRIQRRREQVLLDRPTTTVLAMQLMRDLRNINISQSEDGVFYREEEVTC